MSNRKHSSGGAAVKSQREAAELSALYFMVAYTEAELAEIAPRSAVLAGFLRKSIRNEIAMRTMLSAASDADVQNAEVARTAH